MYEGDIGGEGTGVMEYRQIRAMGGKGSAPSQFATSLRGLAVDAHGQLYAAGDSEIKVFDLEMEYRQIRAMGGKGSAPSQFATSLRGLAVDAHGQLYAAGDSEIKVFDH